jgi:hypothetical protein
MTKLPPGPAKSLQPLFYQALANGTTTDVAVVLPMNCVLRGIQITVGSVTAIASDFTVCSVSGAGATNGFANGTAVYAILAASSQSSATGNVQVFPWIYVPQATYFPAGRVIYVSVSSTGLSVTAWFILFIEPI